jgi:hypothetical protein
MHRFNNDRPRGLFAFAAMLLLAAVAMAAGEPGPGTLLYNGIVLPVDWPEKNLDPKSAEPMPVPYLVQIPKVVPIDVGRQLFIDDFLIETTNLTRVFHAAKDFGGNPVLAASTKAELERRSGEEGEQEAVCYLGAGGIAFDAEKSLFKMWYTAGWRGGLALATSRDGVHWERPELGLAGGNLLLAPGLKDAGWDNGVWMDSSSPNPGERYKLLVQRSGKEHSLHTSADGLKWSKGVSTGPAADYCSFFYNPFRRVWVHSIKRNGPRGRTRYYSETREFMEPGAYRRSVYWTGADRLDKRDPDVGDEPQLYNLHGIAYESVMLGVFSIHLGPSNKVCEERRIPKITELKLGFSRDGFHWDRPEREPFIRATRRQGDWNRAYLHGATGVCFVSGDWLLFPYTGTSGISPSGFRGMYTGMSIGLAVLRRDGFASMEAGGEEGTLTTRPLVFTGERMFVNVDCPKGSLSVEILDPDNAPVKPFTAECCQPLNVNSTIQEIHWRGGETLAALRGRPVKFRFRLTNGRLYSFWVSPDASGASHGYVAAGGPGLSGPIDTQGAAAYKAAREINK